MDAVIVMNVSVLHHVHKSNRILLSFSCSTNSIFLFDQIDYLLITRCMVYIWIWVGSYTKLYVRADTHKCHGYLGSRALTFASRVRWHNLYGPLLTLLVNRLHGAILPPHSSSSSTHLSYTWWFVYSFPDSCWEIAIETIGGWEELR